MTFTIGIFLSFRLTMSFPFYHIEENMLEYHVTCHPASAVSVNHALNIAIMSFGDCDLYIL